MERNFEQFSGNNQMVYSAAPLEVCDEKEIITVRDCSELVDSKILSHSYTPLEIWGIYFNK